MSTDLQKIADTNVLNWDCSNQLKTIKEIYGKKLSNEEFGVFVNLGKATGLNPFLREIWALKYGTEAASIFIARDGYRKSAQSNPNYDYHLTDAVYTNDNFKVINGEVYHEYCIKDRGALAGAYCTVKRKSSSKAYFVYVELKEYDKNQSVWKDKKATMIKKVAEAQCLRMAFQELFAGTHSEDEYVTQDNSMSGRTIKASERLGLLIDGKSTPIITFEEVRNIILNAEAVEDLKPVANLSKNLSEDDLASIRTLYKERKKFLTDYENEYNKIDEKTGEITESKEPVIMIEYEKIKKQLLSAKSRDTLDIAADLIRSCDDPEQIADLMGIYSTRKDQVK